MIIRECHYLIEYVNAMEMPDVFEFLKSLHHYPAAHQFLRAHFKYEPRMSNKRTLQAIESLSRGKAEIPFDRLPVAVQEAIMRDRGCKTFQEYEALCNRQQQPNAEPDLTLNKIDIN